jgi:hypothetical protein
MISIYAYAMAVNCYDGHLVEQKSIHGRPYEFGAQLSLCLLWMDVMWEHPALLRLLIGAPQSIEITNPMETDIRP